MELKRYIVSLYLVLTALTVVSCGYDSFGDGAAVGSDLIVPNVDISHVRSLYPGYPVPVHQDMVIGGTVTANDKSGNFYRTFVIDDGTGAVEVKAGLSELHNVFTVGRYVSVRLQGLTVDMYNGVMQVGLGNGGNEGYATDYFTYQHVMDKYVYPSGTVRIPRPTVISANLLTEGMCGRLVSVAGVTADADTVLTWAIPSDGLGISPQNAYRLFAGEDDVPFAVYTSGYANFAGQKIMHSPATITGILQYGRVSGRNMFIIKMRDINDVVYRVEN